MKPFRWLVQVDSRRSLPLLAVILAITVACSLRDDIALLAMAIVALIGGCLLSRMVFLEADGCGWNTFVVSVGVSRDTVVHAMFASQVMVPAVLTAVVSGACLWAAGMGSPVLGGAAVGAVHGMFASCNVYYSFASTTSRQNMLGSTVLSRKDCAASMGLTVLALFMTFVTCSGAVRSAEFDGLAGRTAVLLVLDVCLMAICLMLSRRLIALRDF